MADYTEATVEKVAGIIDRRTGGHMGRDSWSTMAHAVLDAVADDIAKAARAEAWAAGWQNAYRYCHGSIPLAETANPYRRDLSTDPTEGGEQ